MRGIIMTSFFNVSVFIIFMWINNPHNNLYNFGETAKTLYNVEKISDIRYHRSLAKHGPNKEFDRSRIREKLLEKNSYNNVKCAAEDLSKYSQVKKKELNDLDLYRKLYSHKYSKKKVLGKFDYKCEKIIFDKLDHIQMIADRLKNDNKSFNRKVSKIFGSRLILFVLVPVLGLIIPLLFNKYSPISQHMCMDGCISHGSGTSTSHHGNHVTNVPINKNTLGVITQVSDIFWYISSVVVLLVLIYIFVKFMKYKKLKGGRYK
ncbi:Plasmodium exported protein, unknown function [Plasmodium vivax]|uniref:Variable surface protein Vir35 n=1 Tax=Plasmodium vivax TaxID=5855 RepID=A0A1G4HDJ7_PLAVI|nr:Plasmodium exported protein, unknown function [Plasmodium vivax]